MEQLGPRSFGPLFLQFQARMLRGTAFRSPTPQGRGNVVRDLTGHQFSDGSQMILLPLNTCPGSSNPSFVLTPTSFHHVGEDSRGQPGAELSGAALGIAPAIEWVRLILETCRVELFPTSFLMDNPSTTKAITKFWCTSAKLGMNGSMVLLQATLFNGYAVQWARNSDTQFAHR